jgi:hypothetical protein
LLPYGGSGNNIPAGLPARRASTGEAIRGFQKRKKACHPFAHSIKPGEPFTQKRKLLTRFWRFSYKWRLTLKIPSTS